jgi:hypothetical protein
MMAFTLSKLNMLILVIALFAIITFFMNSLTDLVVSNNAEQLVAAYVQRSDTVILSESLCFKSAITVPPFLTYFGGATQAEKFLPYIIKISSVENSAGQGLNSLIMAIANRASKKNFLAAKRTDTKADIMIYDWDISTDTIRETGETIIDPQAFPPTNSFVLIKEIFRDKTFLHVIPCSNQLGSCSNNTERVGCCLRNRRGVVSACVPISDSCPQSFSC